ncbi:MAG: DUF541 domain-containing protein [Chloroflexi bacterium]|nr:MAG: DUF541 domain-containing protein [Chloroflexota bacterium]MBL1196153.1 DUF541 domain-containing protein [Chloroflexota bacterium]NOH13446.1 SIMPL domain-containing protein [Chloroflexota bacterium]
MNKKMLLIFALLTLALSACVPALGGGQAVGLQEPSLAVNGTGVVTLDPDIVTISIGVNTEDDDAGTAVSRNNRQVEDIMAALSEMGITAEDVQTNNFSIWPRQDYDFEGNPISTSYVVDNTLTVTVRDLDSLGDVLDAAIDAGANSIYGINFSISDREDAISQATQLAMENAEARAQNLAGVASVELGEVLFINSFVGGGGYFDPYTQGLGGGGGADLASVPIASGQLTVTVDVNVTYKIVPAE